VVESWRKVTEHTISELRLGIRDIDSELVRLLGRRLRLVQEIGKLKHKLKMPLIDRATEKAVIHNFVTSASDAGIDKGFVERMAKLIIEESVRVQRSMRPAGLVKPSVARVAIIGTGGMGSWFACFFKSRGNSVTVSDLDQRRARALASKIHVKWASNNTEAVRESDVIILATPTNAIPNVVKEILPALRENALLVDISAVKSPVASVLRLAEKRGVQTASIHPLFGPLASDLRGKKVIVIDRGSKRGIKRAKHILENASTLLTNPQIHDRQTALTLALPHFLNMAFAMTISRRNIAEIRKFAGRTFNLQMLLAEMVASEPETTADIQIMNKEFRAIMSELEWNIKSLAEIVDRHDRAKLIARYERILHQLSADREFALAGEKFERASQAISIESGM
jgi:prephenate dehydrogenase/chorismate mutase